MCSLCLLSQTCWLKQHHWCRVQVLETFSTQCEKLQAIILLFPRLVDLENLSCMTRNFSRADAIAMYDALGMLAYFDPANPTGRCGQQLVYRWMLLDLWKFSIRHCRMLGSLQVLQGGDIIPKNQRMTIHCITTHCTTIHCITKHCISINCITKHCISIHCITMFWCYLPIVR